VVDVGTGGANAGQNKGWGGMKEKKKKKKKKKKKRKKRDVCWKRGDWFRRKKKTGRGEKKEVDLKMGKTASSGRCRCTKVSRLAGYRRGPTRIGRKGRRGVNQLFCWDGARRKVVVSV